MPDTGPKFTAGPPRSGRAPSAKAKGAVPPPDAEEIIASTEPDDDLSDYIVKEEPPVEESPAQESPVAEESPANVSPIQSASTSGNVTVEPLQANTVTTADTELVRRLEAELAAARARLEGKNADVSAWPVAETPKFKDGDTVLIHVREDGFTANGRVWYRGQELEFTVGAQNWRDTLDRNGQSWLQLNEADQLRRYGKVMFGHGPWPGASWDNDRAASAEQRRGRQAPTITQISNLPGNQRS